VLSHRSSNRANTPYHLVHRTHSYTKNQRQNNYQVRTNVLHSTVTVTLPRHGLVQLFNLAPRCSLMFLKNMVSATLSDFRESILMCSLIVLSSTIPPAHETSQLQPCFCSLSGSHTHPVLLSTLQRRSVKYAYIYLETPQVGK
jgi:hypothetical protein